MARRRRPVPSASRCMTPSRAVNSASHLPIPEYDGLVTTIAYPFSPPETDRGPVYEITLNHVVTGITPTELFRSTMEEI